jgi:hypothetical protein
VNSAAGFLSLRRSTLNLLRPSVGHLRPEIIWTLKLYNKNRVNSWFDILNNSAGVIWNRNSSFVLNLIPTAGELINNWRRSRECGSWVLYEWKVNFSSLYILKRFQHSFVHGIVHFKIYLNQSCWDFVSL